MKEKKMVFLLEKPLSKFHSHQRSERQNLLLRQTGRPSQNPRDPQKVKGARETKLELKLESQGRLKDERLEDLEDLEGLVEWTHSFSDSSLSSSKDSRVVSRPSRSWWLGYQLKRREKIDLRMKMKKNPETERRRKTCPRPCTILDCSTEDHLHSDRLPLSSPVSQRLSQFRPHLNSWL